MPGRLLMTCVEGFCVSLITREAAAAGAVAAMPPSTNLLN